MLQKIFVFLLTFLSFYSLLFPSASLSHAQAGKPINISCTRAEPNPVQFGIDNFNLKIYGPDSIPKNQGKFLVKLNGEYLQNSADSPKPYGVDAKDNPTPDPSGSDKIVIDFGEVRHIVGDRFRKGGFSAQRRKLEEAGKVYVLQVIYEDDTSKVLCSGLTLTVGNNTGAGNINNCTVTIPPNIVSSGASGGTPDTLSYSTPPTVSVDWKSYQTQDADSHKILIKQLKDASDKNPDEVKLQNKDTCATTAELRSGFTLPERLSPGLYRIIITKSCGNNDEVCSNGAEVKGFGQTGGGSFNLGGISPGAVPAACPNSICKTAFGSVDVKKPENVVVFLMTYVLSFAGVIAFILLLISGYRLMTSSGDKQQVAAARQTITSAIIGLIVIIFSIVLFQVIAIEFLRLPGITK